MRIRRLEDSNRPVPAGRSLELFARPGQALAPAITTTIELDLAVQVEPGQAVLVLPLPALLAVGISATPGIRTADEPVAPLSLTGIAAEIVLVPTGVAIARGIVLDAPAETFYEDPTLDVLLADPGIHFAPDAPGKAPAMRFSASSEE